MGKISLRRFLLTPHPEHSLQAAWNCIQVGVFIFFLLPTWGGVLIVLGVLMTLKQRFRSIIRQPVNQGLASLSLLLALVSCGSVSPATAFVGLLNFIPYFLVFAGLSVLIQTPNQLRHLARLIIIPAVLIILLGLGQLFLNWSGVELLHEILGWVLEPGGNPSGRMSTVFMYANILAAYLVVVFSLSLGLLLEQTLSNQTLSNQYLLKQPLSNQPLLEQALLQQSRSQNLPKTLSQDQKKSSAILRSKLKYLPTLFWGVAVIITGIGLILTHSRNAWGLAVFIGLTYAVYLGWNWLLQLVIAIVILTFGAAFAPAPIHQPLRTIIPAYFWQRLTDQNFDRPVEILRITQWKFAWNLSQDRPWTGWGLRNFTPLYEAQMKVWLGHPHNLFVMMIAEVGIPITVLFSSLVGWILVRAIKAWITGLGNSENRLVILSYLTAFTALTLFNLFDVTLFDLRVNTLGWLLLSGINGTAHQDFCTQRNPD
ncbi:MAG: O-antigen ligase family protein [Microcoleaceae cyanobacterium]